MPKLTLLDIYAVIDKESNQVIGRYLCDDIGTPVDITVEVMQEDGDFKKCECRLEHSDEHMDAVEALPKSAMIIHANRPDLFSMILV